MGVQQHPGLVISRNAASAWTTPRRFVIETANANEVKIVDAANADALGVTPINPRLANDSVGIEVSGWLIVESGAALAVGDHVVTDSQGRAIKDPETAGVTACVQGRVVTPATDVGQAVTIDRSVRYKIKR